MKIFLTPEAEEEIEYCDTWWRENRPATANLFARELAEAKALIVNVPNIGLLYTTIDGQPVLRVLMKKTGHHLYYAVEASLDRIVVYSVWGARKAHGPRL
jgi:plasmid stabilization system protein ParE